MIVNMVVELGFDPVQGVGNDRVIVPIFLPHRLHKSRQDRADSPDYRDENDLAHSYLAPRTYRLLAS